MARTKSTTTNQDNTNRAESDRMEVDSQGKALPETKEAGDEDEGVKDLPPANPLGEPVQASEAYSIGEDAEINAGTLKPSETVVEHPLSPTDANPNPHGQRSQLDITTEFVDPDTKVARREVLDDENNTVEVTGLSDNPVHLGDGRTLAKGDKAKVSKDVAKQLRDSKQVK